MKRIDNDKVVRSNDILFEVWKCVGKQGIIFSQLLTRFWYLGKCHMSGGRALWPCIQE